MESFWEKVKKWFGFAKEKYDGLSDEDKAKLKENAEKIIDKIKDKD